MCRTLTDAMRGEIAERARLVHYGRWPASIDRERPDTLDVPDLLARLTPREY